jgi:hypothetical protein
MGRQKKESDPFSGRTRALNDEISQIEAEIKRLEAQVRLDQTHPRLRSTAVPHGATVTHPPAPPPPPPTPQEPIFEEVDLDRLQGSGEAAGTPSHYNDLGMRKYDLPALWRRISNHFRGPSTTNPKLVSYLAAGGIQGLPPLRYEKRVTRNRVLVLFALIALILLGVACVCLRW